MNKLRENEPVGRTYFHLNGFAGILVLTQRQKPTRNWPIFRQWDKGISVLIDITICKTDSNIGYFVFSQPEIGLRSQASCKQGGARISLEKWFWITQQVYQKLNPFKYSSSDFLYSSLVDVDVYSSIVLLRDSFPSSYLCQTDTWSVYITGLIAYPEYVESAVNTIDTFHYKEKGTVEPWFNAPLYNERYSSPQ